MQRVPVGFPDMPFKVVCGPAQYPSRFRVASFSGEAAALFLNFCQGFWAFGNHAQRLEQP